MRSARRFLAVACCVALVSSAVGARADVVFGNLGVSGTGALNGTNTDIVTSATASGQYSGLAQGFTTGSSLLYLESVTLGLFAETGTPSRTVSLYSNNAGAPGTQLAVSSAVLVSSMNRYTFAFSPNVSLSASTGYWIVPDADVSWHLSNSFSAPTGLNGSGYSYLGTVEKTFESSNAWVTSPNLLYSISVNATSAPVPEIDPSSLGSVAALLAGVFGLRERRRLKSA